MLFRSIDEVLDDVTDMAFKYSQALLKGADNSFFEIALINDGLNKIGNHLRQKIDQQNIKTAFARIAYMASVLKGKENPRLIKNVDISLIQEIMLPEKYKILERLKVISPEAYFYWVLAVGVKG